jgi:hypothetical protein
MDGDNCAKYIEDFEKQLGLEIQKMGFRIDSAKPTLTEVSDALEQNLLVNE